MEINKGSTIGPYVIVGAISKGGMAEVYEAYEGGTGKQRVALKVSRTDIKDPVYSNSLRQEVDLLAGLKHPGIVKVISIPVANSSNEPTYMGKAVEVPGSPWYYAMEYLQGKSLSDLVSKKKCLPLNVASAIMVCLISTIYYIHKKQIAHLDIKPENILFRRPIVSGSYLEPVLIDFGVAARSEFVRANGGSLQTMSAEYINYSRNTTAPEVKVDFQKVDVYSLGVVMYRMITGEYPFNAWGRDGLTSRIVKGSFDLPRTRNPKLPPEVDELMNRWISKEPIYRPSLIELNRKMLDWAGGNGPYYLTEELVAGDEKRNGGLRTKTQMVNKPTGSETL